MTPDFAATAEQNGHKHMDFAAHNHGALRHSHKGGDRLHSHGIEEIGVEEVDRSHGRTDQLDRIEAELARLHKRIDDFETLAMKLISGGGAKYLALLAKVKG
jgi:hypothetical protein